MDLKKIVEESVIESIFERGWVEQSPEEFLVQCKSYLHEELNGKKPKCSEKTLNKMILNTLMNQLGDEYDLNVYRLRFFPAETNQEYDV